MHNNYYLYSNLISIATVSPKAVMITLSLKLPKLKIVIAAQSTFKADRVDDNETINRLEALTY